MATIQGIYIALFGRPADPIGLAFFNEATNNGADLSAIGDLAGTAEYQSRFEGMNNAQIVTAIYQSLFGRNPELAGLQFFVAQLESGAQNINTIAINILDGAQGDDRDTVDNKIEAANAWTAAVAADPDALAAYQGQAGIDAGVAFLAGITDDESTIPTEAELDAALSLLIAGQPPVATPGETFTLTDAVGEQVTGTDGDDTFVAVLGGVDPTLNVGDQIDGKGGVDTLNLIMDGAGAAALPAGSSIKNVEIVNINQTTAPLTTVNSANFAGVEQLWQIDNAGGNFVNPIAGEGVTAGFRSATDQVATATITAATNAQTELSAAVDGVGTGSALTFADKGGATAEINTINVSGSVATVAGVNQLTLTEATPGDAVTLNLSMTSNTEILFGSTFAGLETFNASGSTGNLEVDFTTIATAADLDTISGGAGGDQFTVNTANHTEDLTIDMGAGNDVLVISDGGAVANDTTTITLGAGNDTVDATGALANIANASKATFEDGLITVIDFNAGEDVLDVTGYTLADNTLQGNISGAADLHAALGVAAANAVNTLVFEYDGNMYVYSDNGAGNLFDNGDGLLEVIGFTRADIVDGQNFII